MKQDELLERFLRYVKIETTSNAHSETIPSTPGQWDLLHMLEKELREAGAEKVTLDTHGYLIARFPSNVTGGAPPVIGFMAHVDTAPDVSGKNVTPQIIENYDLAPIPLGKSGYVLSAREHPALEKHKGDTLITTDGTTLLGADDKAGVAEIMTALFWLKEHAEIPRAALEVIFTPDEETGKGLDKFNPAWLSSRCCYTIDGGELGSIETECFNASGFEVAFKGNVIHPGAARGKLVNALSMAAAFLEMIPPQESPEATDGRYGFYAPMEIEGTLDRVTVRGIIRDFDPSELERRTQALKMFGNAVEAAFPGGKAAVSIKKQYANMYEYIKKDPLVIEKLETAVVAAGAVPSRDSIRGGTDGSRLSEMGIPTPNIFTGGHNYHSRFEWASLATMHTTVAVITHLVRLWANGKGADEKV